MKATSKKNNSNLLNAIKFVILLCIFFEARKVWPSEEANARAQESIAQSKAVREEIMKNPKREVASFNKENEKWAAEFQKLENDDSDRNWFSEVDKLIEN